MAAEKNARAHRPATTARAVLVATASAALATAVVGGTASASAPAPAAVTAGAKPTIVLVHGAFADASSWAGVVKRLQADGYPVVAPAVPLRGPAADAASVRAVIRHVPGPKVLVGHSYGGSVISAAGAGDPEVKALVYVAAFLPEAGETALGLSGKFPGSTLGSALDSVTYTLPGGGTTTDLSIRPDAFHHQFAADVPAGQAALMAATQRPVAEAALNEAATVAAWKEKPSWDVVTTEDLNIPRAAQLFMARRAHARITEVAASHSVAVSHPGTVARVIEEAARTTRSAN